ncbi:response regulator [Phenylobacterium sp.]|uniref:response regulator n=1 Tax=Phenylobacterium sp. TaxID=1871053 RepID=UPI0039835B6F
MSELKAMPGRPLSVLHVDDDPMNLRVVQEILTAFGHAAVMASSGAEALEHLGRQTFDVVLMDIHMPGMTGIEVVEKLRASVGPERNTPVIALTADVISRRPQEYTALGFNDFVSKPILVSGLIASIQRAAGPGEARQPLSRAG